jgi:hypothetical protein
MQTGHRFSSDPSTGAGRSNFNPPPSPEIRRAAKASWSSRAKPTPHKSEPRGTKIATESLARSRPAFARKKLQNGKAGDLVSGRQREKIGDAIGAGPGSRAGRRSGSFRIEEHDVAGSAICTSVFNSSRAERANRSRRVANGSWASHISAFDLEPPFDGQAERASGSPMKEGKPQGQAVFS